MKLSFDFYLGIDQTGAGKIKPKKLKSVLLFKKNFQLHAKLYELEYLNASILRQYFGDKVESSRFGIFVDAVLGLPAETWPYKKPGQKELWRLFQKASGNPFYGRESGFQFFQEFWNSNQSQLPERQCEKEAKANSVFRLKPFQKNIQTGSFRIWKDLGGEDVWLNIFPFAEKENKKWPWLFECYPSFFWKYYLNAKSRNYEHLERSILRSVEFSKNDQAMLKKDKDFQDALVNAYCAHLLDRQQFIFKKPKVNTDLLQKEGWILGLRSELKYKS